MSLPSRLAVIGLGYVGLPLAVALARHFDVVGFDLKAERVAALKGGADSTGEVGADALAAATATFTDAPSDLAGREVYIIAVPTPVDGGNRPDLSAVLAACRTVGGVMGKGAIVVLESTVYPGVTEDICGPALAVESGLECGKDFFLGYSPERINPGDREHRIDTITKVVAGQTEEVTRTLAGIYGAMNGGDIFIATDIRTAEAAKVIENAQRDINIAFVNEVGMIVRKLGLSVYDVLAAADTKWNFLGFRPGLVGGHCIGVDPYYLAHVAREIGHHPEVILAGRKINDGMGGFVATCIDTELREVGADGAADRARRVLVLGLTFKEDVPDLRNTKVVDVIAGLLERGHEVDVHDPLADPHEAKSLYGYDLLPDLAGAVGYDCVVGAVPHALYRELGAKDIAAMLAPAGLVADVKGMWRDVEFPKGLRRWQL